MVPSYLVGQSLEYVRARGYDKKDFTPEQLEADKFLLVGTVRDSYYESLVAKSKGKLRIKKIECASGTYKFVVPDDD